jgi:hypothetical protein
MFPSPALEHQKNDIDVCWYPRFMRPYMKNQKPFLTSLLEYTFFVRVLSRARGIEIVSNVFNTNPELLS